MTYMDGYADGERSVLAEVHNLRRQLAAVPKWTRVTDEQLAELQDGTDLWIVYEGFYVQKTQAQIEEEGATDVEWGDFVGYFTPPQEET